MLESAKGISGAVRLYKAKHNVSDHEANSKILEIVKIINKENRGEKSSSGCVITILVAITSTLSVICLL